MKYRTNLDRILGPDILPKLFEFIEKGTIRKPHLKHMAHEMRVTETFDNHKDDDAFDGRSTFSEMLDKEMLKLINQSRYMSKHNYKDFISSFEIKFSTP